MDDMQVLLQMAQVNKATLRCLAHLVEALPEHLRPDYQFMLKRANAQQEMLLTHLETNSAERQASGEIGT